jgi:hypothetical protein
MEIPSTGFSIPQVHKWVVPCVVQESHSLDLKQHEAVLIAGKQQFE